MLKVPQRYFQAVGVLWFTAIVSKIQQSHTYYSSSINSKWLHCLHSSMMRLLMVVMLAAPTLQSELKILDSLYGETGGPEPCAITCSGIGRYYRWKNGGNSQFYPGKAYQKISTSGCNFVTIPLVTVTTLSNFYGPCPAITQFNPKTSYFTVFTIEDMSSSDMVYKSCNVIWIATGYIC